MIRHAGAILLGTLEVQVSSKFTGNLDFQSAYQKWHYIPKQGSRSE